MIERKERTAAARRDLENALERLIDGKPKHRKLRALAAAKKLRINVLSVALEAGRSRTLIGSNDCRFPDIRKRILQRNHVDELPVTTVTKLVSSLRATNAQLRAEIKALRSQQALILARLLEAEREATARQGSSNAGESNVLSLSDRQAAPLSRPRR